MRRRPVLASVGTLLIAGCLGEGGATGGAGPSTDLDFDARLEAMDGLAYERAHVARTNDRPGWAESIDRPAGHAELYGSSTEAMARIPFEHVDPSRESDVTTFVEETAFDRSRLLYVVGVGRGNTEVTVGVDRLGVHEGELLGAMTVQDAEPGDSMDTYASVLVRATVAGGQAPPTTATIHIDAIHDHETVMFVET